ncbi:helix-turn-helix domain-containing protein [Rhizobium lusitanum]|uniref:Helix-turn-helix domain-containing protein n=1 Tax=Rhizobium lusitanum TaxID=293958 RepID=A0A6L9UGT3_9HYPH|nr:AraC family transcriptional regulator [Rhizobium lusitanum]NEI74531.1 helix-turn-helix domain-containing protein [Rhizobium lusitanum]
MEPLIELRERIIRHTGPEELATIPTAIGGMKLSICRTTTEPIGHVYEPVLVVVIQGQKQTVLGERIFDYGVGQYLVVSVDLPITSHIAFANEEEPFLAVAFTLRPASIASLLLEAMISEGPPVEISGMGVSPAPPDLLDAILRMIRLLERPKDIPILMPGLEREILWRLLNGDQGGLVRQIGLADSRLSQISHAIRWLRSHYAEIIRIEDMAERAGMSLSTFHRHFRAVTAMTPIQYQKQVRLQEARMRLIAESEDVASVGFSVGYDSPSQFSREYSRLFGLPPGRDADRLRQLSPERRVAM